MAQRWTQRIDENGKESSWWGMLRLLFAAVAGASVVLHLGWREPIISDQSLSAITLIAIGTYAMALLIPNRLAKKSLADLVRRHAFESVTLAVGVTFFWLPPALMTVAMLLMLRQLLVFYFYIVETRIPTGVVFVGSFVVLIAVGTAGLLLPAATPTDQPISMLNAVFTITSAISQTGLVIRPTGDGFTRFGHTIILIWIQVGALGVIVFGALLAQVVGSSFGLKATQTIAEGTEQGWTGQLSMHRLIIFIIVLTHAVEAIGALVFYLGWPDQWVGSPWENVPGGASSADRLFHSVFFSVSSFCNAGFATTTNSVEGLRTHWTTHLVIVGLIVFGSIGFPVLDNIRRVVWARIRGVHTEHGNLVRLNLHSKIIITTTVVVYLLGYLVIVLGELTQTNEPTSVVLLDAHFMSINRTSGFDTIAPVDMGPLSRLGLILLMFIGGSPASVAGGIKMMVFAILALTVWATLRGKPRVEAFGRTIPDALVHKSATLIVMSLTTVMLATAVLVATEPSQGNTSIEPYLFEATSAFGTTGLSMGITADLGVPGRIAIIVAMFVGRVGPLAVLAALLAIGAGHRPSYEYPVEEVVIY